MSSVPWSAINSRLSKSALPDTPQGKLGAALIEHVNTDSPEQIHSWAPTILSPNMDASEQSLAAAIRDS